MRRTLTLAMSVYFALGAPAQVSTATVPTAFQVPVAQEQPEPEVPEVHEALREELAELRERHRDRLAAEKAAAEEAARRAEQERQDIAARQERLRDLGWYEGEIDGIAGPRTIAAREDFQEAVGLNPTGEPSAEYVAAVYSKDAPSAPEPEPEPEPEPAPAPEAPVAVAASGIPWDALAQCESGGNWAINTGNGYYGGLQFNVESWRWAGGTGMPHEASRETQIAVAEQLLAIHPSGIGAWPACSAKLGLR